jgi:hypothetical protein
MSCPPELYGEMREWYKDDPVALQQIDVYDPSTEYHDKFREYRDALLSGDEDKQKELEAWFKEHYPDV